MGLGPYFCKSIISHVPTHDHDLCETKLIGYICCFGGFTDRSKSLGGKI
jgi:hypothetical protein